MRRDPLRIRTGRQSPARARQSVGPATAHSAAHSKRLRGGDRNLELPFEPPEVWHEPKEDGAPYRMIVQSAGTGYRHILTPADVRARLAQLPQHFLRGLEVVQFSRMTKKKRSFPCYGMQWGAAIYLYPMEANLVERYYTPPTPAQRIEAEQFGGRWLWCNQEWQLHWTEASIRNFYLNNILIHELGHLVDDRNSNGPDRERFAEWFAIEHGFRPTRVAARPADVKRRHHKRRGRS